MLQPLPQSPSPWASWVSGRVSNMVERELTSRCCWSDAGMAVSTWLRRLGHSSDSVTYSAFSRSSSVSADLPTSMPLY